MTNIYGVTEIAKILGEKPGTVANWVRFERHGIPRPTVHLSMGPVWAGKAIERWIEERAR